MKKFSKWLVLLSIVLCIAILPNKVYAISNKADKSNDLSSGNELKIEKFIEENIDKGKIPGLFVTIVKGDETIYQKGYGYADVDAQRPVNSETLFEIGSNSKAFTALGILNLQKKGLINLTDEVTKYIPWFSVKYKGKEASVTIEQLLHHTSGIPFHTIEKIPASSADSALEDTVKTLIDIDLDDEPGRKFSYATINYDVLGLVIEKVTGVTYEKYIEENIFKTMGLYNTYLYKNDTVNEFMAKGYMIQFLKQHEYDAPTYKGNTPAGYIISNGDDMAKWIKIQLGTSSDSKFDKDIIEESHEANRRVAPIGDGSSYAAGWFIYQKGGGEISHGGNNPNFSSYIIFRPEEKVGIAILSNTNSAYVEAIGRGINEILLGKTYNKEIKDLNKNADIISIIVIVSSGLIIIFTFIYIGKIGREIIKKERFLCRKKRSVLKFAISLVFLIGFSYSIYLIPYILYSGVSWEFVFVWLPQNVKIALYLAYGSIWIVYLCMIIITCFEKEGDKYIFLLSIIGSASGFGNALIIFTINMSINSSNTMRIKLLVYFILGAILYVYGQKIIRGKLIEVTNWIVYSKRIEIIKYVLRAPYKTFEDIDKGRIQSTLNNDTETISRFVNIIIGGITSAITLICCFIYLGTINKYALLLSVMIILLIASIYYLVGRYANRIGEESRELQNIFFKFINDLIGGFKELSLNRKRKNEFEVDMGKCCDVYKVKRGQATSAFANMFVIGELLFTLAIGAISLIFPLILKNLEDISIASYVFILLYMTGPVHGILDTIPNTIDVRISLKRINDLLGELSLFNSEEYDAKEMYIESNVKLKLNDIEFSYDMKDKKSFIVGPVNYEFNSGEIIFITGGNGSGKSTLAKIVTGLYIPTKGDITLNNKKLSSKALNEQCSAIFNDSYLFDKLYGIDYQGKEIIIQEYLKILELENKLQIQEGEFSTTKLSTGQRKRLALLITYLEDKPIYLFDEWAADQDPEFRLFFYTTLLPELRLKNKCVIAITHDDRYFNLADKVIKMELGKLSNT